MEKGNLLETKKKMLEIIKLKGPCLPIHVAKETGISILFASAFLSELASDKDIKISSLKVGGSPLYYLSGQESSLEKFYTYLPLKERESFLLLKKKKILKDTEQEPSIRVALRNIKDFAFPFKKDEEIFWRFYDLSKQQIIDSFKPKTKPTKGIKIQEKLKTITEKPILELSPAKEKKQKPESNFIIKVKNFLAANNIEITEEKDIKKKEFSAIVRINSDFGKIKLLCIAKDKKKATESDLTLLKEEAQYNKMPALFIIPGELNKKAQIFLENWKNLVFFKRI